MMHKVVSPVAGKAKPNDVFTGGLPRETAKDLYAACYPTRGTWMSPE